MCRTSPLGAFEKNSGCKVWVIYDLSWPAGSSINDGISEEDFSVSYTSVNDAVSLCSKYDEPWLAKYDMKDTYLSVAVRESDRNKLGFLWDVNGMPVTYRFSALPFWLRSSSFLFSCQAAGVMYIAKNRGASQDSLYYLDDSITTASTREKCQESLDILTDTAIKCGFKVQHTKKQKVPAEYCNF